MVQVSWSRLSVLRGCPLRHALKYHDRVKVKEDLSVYVVGSTVHKLIERWVAAGCPDEAWLLARVKETFDGYRAGWHFRGDRYVSRLQDAAVGSLVASRVYRHQGWESPGTRFEQRLRAPYGPHTLVGILDVFDGRVWDLKTAKTGDSNPDQLMFYVAALWFGPERLRSEPGGFVYPLRDPDKIIQPVEFNREVWGQFRDRLDRDLELVVDRSYREPTPGRECFVCEYRRTAHCPVTLNEGPDFEGGEVEL